MISDVKTIQRSLIKANRKTLWVPFIRALKEFSLVNENDHVAVCFSGGKDSILLSLLMKELSQHSSIKFKLSILSMDPGFPKDVRLDMEKLISNLGLDAHIFNADLFETLIDMKVKSPCFMCARMRRGFLYKKAKEIGANKIALGHHHDDVAATILMNIIYQSKYMTMMPKIVSKNYENMELIRPLYYVEEKNIIKFIKQHDIPPVPCSCDVKLGKGDSKRDEVKKILEYIMSYESNAKNSIVNSAKNVSFGAILSDYEKAKNLENRIIYTNGDDFEN